MQTKKNPLAKAKYKSLFFLIGLNVSLLLVLVVLNHRSHVVAQVISSPEPLPPDTSEAPVLAENKPIPDDLPKDMPLPEPTVDDIVDIIEEPDVEQSEVIEPKETPIETPVIPTVEGDANPTIDFDPSAWIDAKNKAQKTSEEREEEEIKPLSADRVTHMAVYPGCEKEQGDKKKLLACFSDEISKDVMRFLDTNFPKEAQDKALIKAQLKFIVNTKGEIVDIKPIRGDEEMKPMAKEALESTAAWLKRKKKYITPARTKDNKEVPLIFTTKVALQNPQ